MTNKRHSKKEKRIIVYI